LVLTSMASRTISVKPGPAAGSLQSITKIRLEQIVRMRVNGIKDERICTLLNINPHVFKYITAKDEYKETEEAYLVGHLNKMDEALAGNLEELKRNMRHAVPAALRCVMDVVNQRRDLPSALRAASEIFDRDPDNIFIKKDRSQAGTVLQVPAIVFEQAVKEGDAVTAENKK
jgi:hypothetical protein